MRSFISLEVGLKLGNAEKDHLVTTLPCADGAVFNSYERQHEAKCLPNARVDLLHSAMEWTIGASDKRIFWRRASSRMGVVSAKVRSEQILLLLCCQGSHAPTRWKRNFPEKIWWMQSNHDKSRNKGEREGRVFDRLRGSCCVKLGLFITQ
jgi:hypothetical protein